ncbi:MBL fold metallo-hydrolase [Fusibacter sp. JL216-2]|uniref:MBL fold metallo-hydrolase n=1 Tax=Fusibacter sp. JL216-2 TaxID=3071453 RepID=UPI003D324D30
MKIEIIGSGGCVSLPKPLCACPVCMEAREKGRPYSRFGCSIFIHDIDTLIDTPEDICHAINYSGIKNIKRVLYSHADPDHALGFRVFEQLRLNWFDVSEGKECSDPIEVLASPSVMNDLNAIHSKYGPFLDYYENIRKLIVRKHIIAPLNVEGIKITHVPSETASVFILEKEGKKVLYAPCDVKPFPHSDLFEDADLMIIGDTIVGEKLKNNYVLAEDSFLRAELFNMVEIQAIKSKYKIKKVVITHLEEDWGKSYDDYKALEKGYSSIEFAYDGMILEL